MSVTVPESRAESSQPQSGMARTFNSLRVREFRYLSGGTLSANFADWANRIGTGWLVFVLTDSAAQLGAYAFTSGIIGLGSTPAAGMLADRLPRARVVIAASLASVVLASVMAVLVLSGAIALWHVYILGSISAVTNAAGLPARQALVHDVTTPELLPNAVALNSLVMNVARLIGPPLFGVLAAVNDAAPFLAIIALQLIDAAAIRPLGLKARPRAGGPPRNPLRELWDGLRYVFSDRTLLSLFLIMFTASIVAYPYLSLFPVFAEEVLHAGSVGYGLLFAMAGMGSIIGLVLLANLSGMRRRGPVMLGCYFIHLTGIAVYSQMEHLWLAMLSLFLGGIAIGMGFALYYTLFQLHVRDDMRGRALAIAQMANQFFTVGALPMGLTIGLVGIQHGILLHVIAAALIILVVTMVRPEWRRL
ncbi:hypothetical protein AYO38_07855 [bacterium SCGC AG-212-C10]|nr:hypothetical protein AYO38_07855 [bacterium SCGC AG-212-C10]